jgi:hypothetical protein
MEGERLRKEEVIDYKCEDISEIVKIVQQFSS